MSAGVRHAELDLWQAAGQGFERLFQSASGHDVVRGPGGMLALTGVASPDLNCGVIWAAARAATTARTCAEQLRRRGLPGILLVADLAGRGPHDALAEEGMIAAARMPLMVRGRGPITADSRFTVRRATLPSDLGVANRLIAAAFELPVDLLDRAFAPHLPASGQVAVDLVMDGGEPVGAIQTSFHDGLIGIWSMATPPALRRRGIARAGLSRVLARQFKAGDSLAFLIATDAGRPLYHAVGFEIVAWCTAWLSPLREIGS